MSDQWHYLQAGNQKGPVSFSELQSLAESGQLQPEDLVWQAGMPQWLPAHTVEGLAFQLQVAAPPSRPSPSPQRAPTGEPFAQQILLHLKRAFAWNLETLPITPEEKKTLTDLGITHSRAQCYLCWRRSLLWVIVLPTLLAALLYVVGLFEIGLPLTSFGVLILILDALSHFALPVAVFFGAIYWMRPTISARLVMWTWGIAFLYPMLQALLPLEWWVDLTEAQAAQPGKVGRELVGIILGFAYYISLMPTVLSVIPGILRACLRIKMLIPESTLSGWFLIGAIPLYGLLFLVTFIMINQMIGNALLLLGMLLLLGAPLIFLTRASLFIFPVTSPEQKQGINQLRLIQLGAISLGMFFLLIYLFSKEVLNKSLVGFTSEDSFVQIWQLLRFGVEYLGRSLFITVVVAHLFLRATIIAEQANQTAAPSGEEASDPGGLNSLRNQLELGSPRSEAQSPEPVAVPMEPS